MSGDSTSVIKLTPADMCFSCDGLSCRMAFPLCAFVSTLLIIKNPFSHSFLSLLLEAATYVTDGKTNTVEVRREGTVQESRGKSIQVRWQARVELKKERSSKGSSFQTAIKETHSQKD